MKTKIKLQVIKNGIILCTVPCIDLDDAKKLEKIVKKDGYQTKLITNK